MLPALATPSQQQPVEALPSEYSPSLQVKNTFLELPPDLPSHWHGTKSSRRVQSAPPALVEAPAPVARTTSAPFAVGSRSGHVTPESESEAATILAPLPGMGKGACGSLGAFGARRSSQPSAASASTCSSVRSMVALSFDGDGTSRENTDFTFISRENTFLSRENTLLSRENTLLSGENMSQLSRENTDLTDCASHKWMSPTSATSQAQAWMQWPPMPTPPASTAPQLALDCLPMPPPPASTAPQLAPVPGPPPPPVTPPRAAGNSGKLEKQVWDMYELGSPELPTLGSVGHYFRKCKPCAFVHKQEKGCNNGTDCPFCHLCEPGEKRRRQHTLIEKRRRQQRCKREKVRGEQERNPGEQGHMQEFEDMQEYEEEGYIGALSITKAPHISAPRRGIFNHDPKDGHAARPFTSKAARIAAPGGGNSSKEEEQWLSI